MFSNIGSAFMFLSAESTWHADRARRLLDCGCAKETVYAICGEMNTFTREEIISAEERKLFLEPMVVSPQRPPSATDYANLRYEVTHRQRVIDRLKEREAWFEQRIEQLEKFGKEVSAELGEMKKKHPPPPPEPCASGKPPPLRLSFPPLSLSREEGLAWSMRKSVLEDDGNIGGMTPALPLLPIPSHSLKKEVSWHELGSAESGGEEGGGSKTPHLTAGGEEEEDAGGSKTPRLTAGGEGEGDCEAEGGGSKTPRLTAGGGGFVMGQGSAECSPGCSCVWTNTWCMDRNAHENQLSGGAMTSGAAAAAAAAAEASALRDSSATPGLPQPPPRIDLGGTWGVRMEPFSVGKEQVAEDLGAGGAGGAEEAEEDYEQEEYDPNQPWCDTCHPQSGCDGDHGDEMRGGHLIRKGRDYRLFPELKAPAACFHGHIGSDPPCRTCWEEDGSNSPWLRTRWGMAEIMKGGGGSS
jgi:hypothetical protein